MKKRVVLFVLVVSAVLWGAGAYAATATTFYRGYCIGSDGRVIGLGAVDESEIGKSVAFRFVAEDGTVRQVERLAGDKMVSTRLTLEDGRIVRDEAYSKGQLASVRTYTYDADGRVASESYAQHAKGESQHKYTKTYRYDEAGRVAEIRNEQATGSVQVEVYDGGVLVERRMIDRQGRLSRRYR